MKFRLAGPDDADAIRELVRTAYARWVPLIGREPVPMTVDYAQALLQHRFDILAIDGEMAGLIETIAHPDHLWIENVAVAPERQGQGLGRQLLARAEHLAFGAGLAEIRLLTNAAFEANVALYRRLGYGLDRQEPFRGGTTVYMSKRLG